MSRRTHPSRRLFISSAAALVFTAGLPGTAVAFSEVEAKNLVAAMVTELNAATASGRSETDMFREVEILLSKYSDIPMLARSSLGVAWRSANDDQRAAFIKVFGGYLSRKYGRTFQDFAIAKVQVSQTRKVTTGYVVSSLVHLTDGTFYSIEWQVVNIGGKDKLVNLVIEGLSLLATERQEIAAMLDARGGDLDRLINDLASTG